MGRIIACLALVLTVIGLAHAQSSGGNFAITKSIIANGGATLSGGDFKLSGSVGQMLVGVPESGDFVLESGYWHSERGQVAELVFADEFE